MCPRLVSSEEAAMKRQWTIRRTAVTRSDAVHRWDRAYQHLLRWATQTREEPRREEEATDARSDLRSGLDHAKLGLRRPTSRLRGSKRMQSRRVGPLGATSSISTK